MMIWLNKYVIAGLKSNLTPLLNIQKNAFESRAPSSGYDMTTNTPTYSLFSHLIQPLLNYNDSLS